MAGGGSPCGACKFLRRKCVKGCPFAPYFSSEELGAGHFAAIHKVFGASNFSKLLLHVPLEERYDAVVSISYEAQARLQDPIYGCVSHIFALQHQVAYLQAELTVAHAKLACNSEGIPVSPEYMTGKHCGISSPSNNSPCGNHCPSNEPQSSHQSGSDNNTTFYNDKKGSYFPTSINYNDGKPLSANQQMNSTFQDERESWESDTAHGGDLQALAFALLRRSRK